MPACDSQRSRNIHVVAHKELDGTADRWHQLKIQIPAAGRAVAFENRAIVRDGYQPAESTNEEFRGDVNSAQKHAPGAPKRQIKMNEGPREPFQAGLERSFGTYNL